MSSPTSGKIDNVIIGSKATKSLLSGVKTATDAIRLSYGSRGVNAIIEQELYPYHTIANDCETILQAIRIEEPYENIGLDILKELSSKANKDSGDGRKTTCIMGEEIITRGFKSPVLGVQLKRELDDLIPFIEKRIDDQKVHIAESDVYKVATVASESAEMGNILGEIYQKIGKDGIIIPEASGTYQTTTEYIEGIRFGDTGYLSPYMVHDELARKEGRKETVAVYENPTILVTKRKISHLDDINPLLETLTSKGKKDLIIFTDDMDSGVASILVKAHREHVFNIMVIKAPILWKNYVFEDFSRVTGSTVIEDASGVNFKNLRIDHLGTCAKITVDKDEITIIPSAHFAPEIASHVESLKQMGAKGDNDAMLRLSWLTTQTCILRIGANNESELSYRRLKCYDAINASRLALRDGIVVGGGIALYQASMKLPDTAAGRILTQALREPYRQILRNAGVDKSAVTEDPRMVKGKMHGYDCTDGEFRDLMSVGIVDAAAVVKNAVRNAVSLASTVLTGRIIVKIPSKSPEEIAAEVLKNRGMRF